MRQAVRKLAMVPDFLLVDALTIERLPMRQKGIIKGDKISLSIACASIIAKVARDRMMVELDGTYPDYGFANHKGYGTKEHLSSLRKHGPSPIHRCSFAPVMESE
jgi:ribonuclease HII